MNFFEAPSVEKIVLKAEAITSDIPDTDITVESANIATPI